MFKWKKLGHIFDPTTIKGKPWLKEFAQAPHVVIGEDSLRVYFSCRSERDSANQYTSYSAFIDLDRKNPTKVINIADAPVLSLGDKGTFDEFGIYPVSTINIEDKVRMYYGGWTRCESTPYTVSIGVAESTDGGVSFNRLGNGPILTSNVDDPYVISGPKIRKYQGKYFLWYVAGIRWEMDENIQRAESIYKIKMATSLDGITWDRIKEPIIDNKLEESECQASPDVFFKNGKYHMFFCYKYGVDFRNSARGYRIGYAVSDDCYTWERKDEWAGIDISREGFDNESIAYPHVFEVDGNIYMLYLGNEVGKFGFGLAVLDNQEEAFI